MSFIQMDQKFLVKTDSTENNTGEDIIGKTGENTVRLTIYNKRFMTPVDTEKNIAGEDFSHPWKDFKLAALSRNMNRVSRKICLLLF